MKINTILALLAMVALAITDYGWVKAICFIILMVNFVVFAKLFEEDLCESK